MVLMDHDQIQKLYIEDNYLPKAIYTSTIYSLFINDLPKKISYMYKAIATYVYADDAIIYITMHSNDDEL